MLPCEARRSLEISGLVVARKLVKSLEAATVAMRKLARERKIELLD